MKKKSNGKYRARLNARGYEQVDGVRFDSTSILSPVTSDATMRIVLVLSLIFGGTAELFSYVQGAFLWGNFQDEEQKYMSIPEGFKQCYPTGWLLLLLQTIYGMRQAYKAFFVEVKKYMTNMSSEKSEAEPCLLFAWNIIGLVLWVTWVDDCCVLGDEDGVKAAKEQMKSRFDCDFIGELTEYVHCNIEKNSDYVRFTQPVLLQSYEDGFDIEKD
jgi:hypothetical protein